MRTVPLPVPLIAVGDLPVGHIGGRIQSNDNPRILQNVGNAINVTVQSIYLRDKPGHLGGSIQFYLYQNDNEAVNFYNRLIAYFEGQSLTEIGDQALIATTPHILQFPKSTTTAIRFRRGRAVVDIVGSYQPDPSFSQSYLTREDVVAYAHRLDLRLIRAL